MLTITQHKGIHLRFANGYGVSVQFGPSNYCEHYNESDYRAPAKVECWESKDAEVAIFLPGKGLGQVPGITDDWGDDVKGYLTADEVAALIAKVAAL